MLKTLLASMTAAAVLCSMPAMSDRRHADRHGYDQGHYSGYGHNHGRAHNRGYYGGYYGGGYGVQYRPLPRYRVDPVAVQYYYNEPVHYHYAESRYVAHHGHCNNAFLWLGGAMVLSEIIHHASH